ncbi:hypothetical protein [Lacipirellula sp.]|uniref:hypothetical protein n=1 Tax=Lacipirellula sp. TaxID=2691419 RepID=UPI003D0C5BFD
MSFRFAFAEKSPILTKCIKIDWEEHQRPATSATKLRKEGNAFTRVHLVEL